MQDFNSCKERLLKLLQKEISKTQADGESNTAIESYISMVNNIIKYIEKNTKDGIYRAIDKDNVDNDIRHLESKGIELLGTAEWKRYMKFFMNGNTHKYDVRPTDYGKIIWRKTDEYGVRCEEGQRASRWWHKLKVLVEDFNLEKWPREASQTTTKRGRKSTKKTEFEPVLVI